MKRGNYVKEIPKRTINCHWCDKLFVCIRPTRKYCSSICTQRNFSSKKEKSKRILSEKVVKQCAYCGDNILKVNYKSTGYKKAYCNQEHMILGMKKESFKITCVICNTVFQTQPSSVKHRNRKTCSRSCASKLKTIYAEINALIFPPTKGLMNRRIRYSKKMKEWRISVFERDNYTCQGCNNRGGTLNADHIKPFAYYPELRFDINNGRTLCVECHKKTPTYGAKAHTHAMM